MSVRRAFFVALRMRGKDTVFRVFFYFNSKVSERLPKKLPIGKMLKILLNCPIKLKNCY